MRRQNPFIYGRKIFRTKSGRWAWQLREGKALVYQTGFSSAMEAKTSMRTYLLRVRTNPKNSEVQSFLFRKSAYSFSQAFKWISEHFPAFRPGVYHVEKGPVWMAIRMKNPRFFKRIRTVQFSQNIKARMGYN